MTHRISRPLPVLVLTALLAACPGGETDPQPDGGPGDGTDAGLVDAGSPEDGGSELDGGAGSDGGSETDGGSTVTSCDDLPGAPGCLTNEDCASSELCTGFGDPDNRCCAEGSRGTGETGEPCSGHDDCAFGRCVEREDGQSFCSGPCGGDMDCPGVMFCSDLFGWCVPTIEVTSCAQLELDQCFYNLNCQDSDRCENLGTADAELFCCTTGPRGTGEVGEACESELDCVYGRCIGGLCSAECDFDNDPCPQETMYCDTIRGRCEPL